MDCCARTSRERLKVMVAVLALLARRKTTVSWSCESTAIDLSMDAVFKQHEHAKQIVVPSTGRLCMYDNDGNSAFVCHGDAVK